MFIRCLIFSHDYTWNIYVLRMICVAAHHATLETDEAWHHQTGAMLCCAPLSWYLEVGYWRRGEESSISSSNHVSRSLMGTFNANAGHECWHAGAQTSACTVCKHLCTWRTAIDFRDQARHCHLLKYVNKVIPGRLDVVFCWGCLFVWSCACFLAARMCCLMVRWPSVWVGWKSCNSEVSTDEEGKKNK